MKIILIDDHALIRAAMISALVGSRFEVVAQASSVNEALAMINTHNPDIALVDINLGSATGIDLIKTAIKSGASCKFVILTMHDDEQMLEQAKLAGASQITMITRQKTRRDLAVTLGATDSVDPLEKNYPDKLSKYDVVFECAGAIESFNAAQVIARRGGSIVVLGLTPEKSFVDFNPFQLVIKELRIQGSFLNPLTQRRAANLIDSKKLKLDPLISRVLTLDEVPEILNKPPADGDIKYIIKP